MKFFKAFLLLFLMQWATVVYGRVLYFGNKSINLLQSCTSTHKLNVQYGNEYWCAPLTTTWASDSLHVEFGGTTYTVCDGECPDDSGYVMPETPAEPVELPESCEWTQTNANAYLLSDGNQYFDTGVTVDTSVNIDLTVQVVNGYHARIFGTKGSTCYFDFTLNKNRGGSFRIGTYNSAGSFSFSEAQSKRKIRYYTSDSGTRKRVDANGTNISKYLFRTNSPTCTDSSKTILVFDNDLINSANLDPSLSGGMKLYYIKLYDSSGNLIHDYQPVAAGTDICGYTAPTNAMWDFVDKKLYLPAGTGEMGYGVDE